MYGGISQVVEALVQSDDLGFVLLRKIVRGQLQMEMMSRSHFVIYIYRFIVMNEHFVNL